MPNQFSDRELIEILSLSPNATAVYSTDQIIIQTANDAMLAFWGKNKSVIGLPLEQALPELAGQPFIDILKDVWNTGITFEAKDTGAELLVEGKLQTFYFDFVYRPVKNNDGKVYCILHTTTNVTQQNLNQFALDESRQKEQQLYEELAATNEELTVINEELLESQQNLQILNNQLEIRVAQRTIDLIKSEGRFRGIFEQSPLALSVLKGRDLVIESANDNILKIWGKTDSVIGLPLVEALPELKGQVFLAILDDVLETGNPYYAYETKAIQIHNGERVEVYVDFVYAPLVDEAGKVTSVLVSAIDVTQRALSGQREQQLNEELMAANEELTAINEELMSSQQSLEDLNDELEERVNTRTQELAESEAGFRNMVIQAPVAISLLSGRDLIVQTANEGILELWGKGESVIGKKLAVALPELVGQPFLKILDDVYTSGKAFHGNEYMARINRNNQLHDYYFNFVYHPLKNTDGATESIMVVATEVTDQITARKKTETSEHRLNRMVMTAPIGMTVLRGKDLVIEIANKNMLSIWNRTAEQVVGKELMVAFPELHNQPFPGMLREVLETGKQLSFEEMGVDVASLDGKGLVRHYVNFSYDPLFDLDGNVDAILATVMNITERVEARNELLQLQERSRLAVNAAQLGTFDMDLKKGILDWDNRCRELFGIYHDNPVTYDYDFVYGLHPDDRERVQNVIADCMDKSISNGDYDVDYRTVGFSDKQVRWVRAKGKVFFDDADVPVRFVGAVLDITAQKQDEQRKNDFIAMVSHELKTPLTSLKAYVQMLMIKARKGDDNFTEGALDKVNKQVKKMTVLINGFLNVSRLEAGKIYLEKKDFNIDELIQQTVEEITLTTHSHQIIYTHSESVVIHADYDKIGQVINNFLSNAAKYSPKGRQIEIACSSITGMVQVSVKDDGIGISQHDQEKLFARFYRVDNQDTKTISGFGIGLYLCAEIIRRHDGLIWVESEMGKGSTFYFSLPITNQ